LIYSIITEFQNLGYGLYDWFDPQQGQGFFLFTAFKLTLGPIEGVPGAFPGHEADLEPRLRMHGATPPLPTYLYGIVFN